MKNISIISIAIITLFSSCKKDLDLDLNTEENQRLVVDALFSTYAQEHVVKLNMTANYYSADSPEKISGASVSISDGTNVTSFFESSPGIYKTVANATATFSKEHTLTIDYNGKTYTAKNYCDTVPVLDTVIAELFTGTGGLGGPGNGPPGGSPTGPQYEIKFSTQELIGFGDSYAWKIYVNGVLRNDSIAEQLSNNDEFLPDGTYFNEVQLTIMDDLHPGDTIVVAQHAISEETYDAYIAILFQTQFKGGIFDAPPANIPTNLSEGAVGLFSVTGEVRAYTVVP